MNKNTKFLNRNVSLMSVTIKPFIGWSLTVTTNRPDSETLSRLNVIVLTSGKV